MDKISRHNNFDLIRLIAALQVLCWHSWEHFELPFDWLNKVVYFTRFFPGVPIFFTISGFLIYASFERNRLSVRQYFRNRILRIYPGLWCVVLFTLILMIGVGYLRMGQVFSKEIIAWLIAQMTILQTYTPNVLREFGVGTPNGSLWTIGIELSFYIFLPIFFLIKKMLNANSKSRSVLLIIIFFIASYAFNQYFFHKYASTELSNVLKLVKFSLLPYLFYFLLGCIIYVAWAKVQKWYVNKALYWALVYLIYIFVFSIWLHKYSPSYWPNLFDLISIIILSQLVISFAFTKPHIANILKGNDISYGVYLYHMPVMNTFIYLGYKGTVIGMILLFVVTICLAIFSWRFVEKRFLRMKVKYK
jgi:Predicted acyltransferases